MLPVPLVFLSKFPTQQNREFFKLNRGLNPAISELYREPDGLVLPKPSNTAVGAASRVLATPEFKANHGTRTELKANSFSGGC